MYKNWSENLMGEKPCDKGKSYLEIDESKIITYN